MFNPDFPQAWDCSSYSVVVKHGLPINRYEEVCAVCMRLPGIDISLGDIEGTGPCKQNLEIVGPTSMVIGLLHLHRMVRSLQFSRS